MLTDLITACRIDPTPTSTHSAALLQGSFRGLEAKPATTQGVLSAFLANVPRKALHVPQH